MIERNRERERERDVRRGDISRDEVEEHERRGTGSAWEERRRSLRVISA